jgi:hypothetical protein
MKRSLIASTVVFGLLAAPAAVMAMDVASSPHARPTRPAPPPRPAARPPSGVKTVAAKPSQTRATKVTPLAPAASTGRENGPKGKRADIGDIKVPPTAKRVANALQLESPTGAKNALFSIDGRTFQGRTVVYDDRSEITFDSDGIVVNVWTPTLGDVPVPVLMTAHDQGHGAVVRKVGMNPATGTSTWAFADNTKFEYREPTPAAVPQVIRSGHGR